MSSPPSSTGADARGSPLAAPILTTDGGAKGRFRTASHWRFHSAALDGFRASVSDLPTQAQAQVINGGPVAAVTLLNEIRAALVEKGVSERGA